MRDHDDILEQIEATALHQVLILDGVTQLLRRRLEEEMPIELFSHLTCTLTELGGQLLHWSHALREWADDDPDGVLDPEEE